jgi:hypothetical protein
VSEGRLQFDDRTYELPLVELRFYNAGADWNLGRDGVFWLSGRASPGPASTADLANVELTIDERALDEMLAAVTGVSKTFYPPGGLSGPSLHLEVTPSVESTAMISPDRARLGLLPGDDKAS